MRRTGRIGALLLALLLALEISMPQAVQAAVPLAVTKKKAVLTFPYKSGKINIYGDSAGKKKLGKVKGKSLLLTIQKAEGSALYCSYKSGKKTVSAWFPQKAILPKPSYEKKDAMLRYSVATYDRPSGRKIYTIPAYTDVDIVGKSGKWYQITYAYKGKYRLTWIKKSAYENAIRIFDGTEKKQMAEGTYSMRAGTGYSKILENQAGKLTRAVTGKKALSSQVFTFTFTGNNCYKISTKKGKLCLAAEYKEKKVTAGDEVDPMMAAAEPAPAEEETTEDQSSESESEKAESETAQETESKPAAAEVIKVKTYTGKVVLAKPVKDDPGQIWELIRDGSTYYLKNKGTGKYLNMGSKVTLKKKKNSSAQKFRLTMTGGKNTKHWQVFSQYDSDWGAKKYGRTNTMAASACGILSSVNAVYYLNGQFIDPMELAKYAVKKGYRVEGSGTLYTFVKAAAKKFGMKYGYKYAGSTTSLSKLQKHLKGGGTAVAYVPHHYMAVGDYKNGKYLALDSYATAARKTSPFGCWISGKRFQSGTLAAKNFLLLSATK